MDMDDGTLLGTRKQVGLEDRIRELWGLVRDEHRELVIKSLESYHSNYDRLSYLRGWLHAETQQDASTSRRKRNPSPRRSRRRVDDSGTGPENGESES